MFPFITNICFLSRSPKLCKVIIGKFQSKSNFQDILKNATRKAPNALEGTDVRKASRIITLALSGGGSFSQLW